MVPLMNTSPARSAAVPRLGNGALGRLLKQWRGRRGYSQLDLALAARTTQRHISFLESGRAAPSRDMVLRLAATLNLPLRQQNVLLLAAGYAPAWRERDLSAPGLATVTRALDYILAQHEPFPAFVVDRRWNLLRANRGAARLTEFLTGSPPAEPTGEPINLAMALMSPEGLRPFIANWPEVALHFLRGRTGRRLFRWDRRDVGAVDPAAFLTQRACPVRGIATGRRPCTGAGDSLSSWGDFAAPVHHDRYARHTTGHHTGGSPYRVLLSD